ncbi:MAG: hypothetical protein R3F59_10660, partial [Myxococcota bacterium]
ADGAELVREIRPMLAKAANKVRKAGAVDPATLGLDADDAARVAAFLAELVDVVGLLAEVE